MSAEEFDSVIGMPTKIVHSPALEMRSTEEVHVQGNEEENTFKVSGEYDYQLEIW